jgi:sulfur transfer protein SufE
VKAVFKWFVSLFGRKAREERARKKEIKRLARSLATNKYRLFFKIKSAQVTPELAQFFYSVYKAIAPAQRLLRNAAQSTQLKLRTAAYFLDQRQLDIVEGFSAKSIEKRAEKIDSGILFRQLQGELADLEQGFDTGRINSIDGCYDLMMLVCKFVTYDYSFLLKKFNPQLIGNNLNGEPVFSFLRGEAIVEELKDFLELTGGLDPRLDWKDPLQILDEYAGMEVIGPKVWNDILSKLWTLNNSGIFELMIRFIEKNPAWTWNGGVENESIVGFCMEQVRGEVFDCFSLAVAAKQDALIQARARAVFGNAKVIWLKYYTEQGGEIFRRKNFSGFTEARALNYLMAFLSEVRSELQELYELLHIRGHWASMGTSLRLSDSLWLLAAFPARITELDEKLSDWGIYGVKLRPAILKVDRDGSVSWLIAKRLESANDEARQIVDNAVFHLSILNDGLKELLEDCRKNVGIIILNWDKLNAVSEIGLRERLSELRGKLENMLELLRTLAHETESREQVASGRFVL